MYLQKWLRPRTAAPGAATLHFRLIMADVERSLHEARECNDRMIDAEKECLGLTSAKSVGWFGGMLPSSPCNSPGKNRRTPGGSQQGTPLVPRQPGTGSRTRNATKELDDIDTPLSPMNNGCLDNECEGNDDDEGDATRLVPSTEAIQQHLFSVFYRRKMVARGTLMFNLVRLRSEFHNLFGSSRSAVSSRGGGGGIIRGSTASQRSLSFTAFGTNAGASSSLRGEGEDSEGLGGGGGGIGGGGGSTARELTSTLRKWRMRRSSSAAISALAQHNRGRAESSSFRSQSQQQMHHPHVQAGERAGEVALRPKTNQQGVGGIVWYLHSCASRLWRGLFWWWPWGASMPRGVIGDSSTSIGSNIGEGDGYQAGDLFDPARAKAQQEEEEDMASAALVKEVLSIMRRNEYSRESHISLLRYVALAPKLLLRAFAGLLLGPSEELTSTTQFASLNRDISLLESPDFEVSLDRKVATSTRMRTTYNCLMPYKQ
jgi:hypothetical protein